MQRRRDRFSISFSIAYVRVCEWVRGEEGATRPKPEILEKALAHARRMEDFYIIRKIHEAQGTWKILNETPTPRDCLPPPSLIAYEEDDRITKRFRRISQTKPYSALMPSEAELLDEELDLFLLDTTTWE